MKSEKAKAYLNSSSMNPNSPLAQDQCYVWHNASVIKAIELAEQEAEERMRQKAIKAHRACCPLNELQCIHRDRDDYNCTYDCKYVISFIQKLNEV